ncbi:cytidyltransferase [Geosporobacter ferrireducens]|uniref:nicotinate-nucleotide adenylyltransferase n=1 Tax=Geosporobacter ferrireducens TaxID=1424294 RepID=A0A1D8GEA9_9FIRM|nr:cytidyltransferase [Geosporobacter ferrireducens]AOT69249.1 cytidyltransferase [Geosporobacter ferrireducens]MTI56931.1 cytidyltransferase [Geosporobacter ferrireducens]
MTTAVTKELYHQLRTALFNQGFLEIYHLEKEFIKKHTENLAFINEIHRITESKDYSCNAVYLLCQDMLKELWGDHKPINPLEYIFQFALSKSFPHSIEVTLDSHLASGCQLYLTALRIVSEFQKEGRDLTWQSRYPLVFLTDDERSQLPNPREYTSFVKAFQEEYIYEMMKLNYEVIGHNTLDHICGVHYLALFIARQLQEKGIPLDLGRVSGAAAGHDIGKYGCRSFESNRVPYLHYYYTDQWFKKHNLPYIGHIALNHSVWDLELENLSLESLILIYCDFRVKNASAQKNQAEMKIYNLQESFEVILSKLDNVDTLKERRYTRVYGKLKDFEDYMRDIGIVTELTVVSATHEGNFKKYYSLMSGSEVTQNIKYIAIHHNIHLMHRLRDEASLNEIIEIARSETDANVLREYLDIFEEYSTYLTQKQKLIMMKFLYEQLIHAEQDIRRQCAELIGRLIASFDEDYKKEIPEGERILTPAVTGLDLLHQYLQLCMFPDHKIIAVHRRWIRYSISALVASFFAHCSHEQIHVFRQALLNYYNLDQYHEEDIQIDLLETLKYIPLCTDDTCLSVIFQYVLLQLDSANSEIRISALEVVYFFIRHLSEETKVIQQIRVLFSNGPKHSELPAENFLLGKIYDNLFPNSINEKEEKSPYELLQEGISDVFLSNMKTATNWVSKKVHVELLLDYTLCSSDINKLYTAMHFCNLLKVSAMDHVRSRAGEALVRLFPNLPLEQRNDVAIELIRSLEIEGIQFAKYIPNYLGRVILYLKPVELDEIIADLIEKIKQSNAQISTLLLKTIGIFISHYPKYRELFPEEEERYNRRLENLLGILLNGLVHDHPQIKQMSFSVIGKDVFGSKLLTLEAKHRFFKLMAKKILSLLPGIEDNELLILTNSAGLNHIYRFISDYTFFQNAIQLDSPEKIAFFPGSFDPFTLGHKEITREIRDMGFEVYLAVDEFSWSKRTQPNLIRQNIIHMSVADEMNIYLYPDDFPINIANPEDLNTLQNSFPHAQVYMVVGSDVILNASAYRDESNQHELLQFPHIVFERRDNDFSPEENIRLQHAMAKIVQPVIKLNLPPQYEDISSSQIRGYIDENREISKLIDPLAQKYVYDNNLYRREPQYKSFVQTISIDVELRDHLEDSLAHEISSLFHGHSDAFINIKKVFQKPGSKMILIRDAKEKGKMLAYSVFHRIPAEAIFQEFRDTHISQCIRENYTGRIVLIDGIFILENTSFNNLHQIILTETLAHCLKNDYGYGIYYNRISSDTPSDLIEILQNHGFQDLPCSKEGSPVMAVNMVHPCTISLDVENFIKEPFRESRRVQKVILECRKRLQNALTKLYPGQLVLSFDSNMINETLVKKICFENEVPSVPLTPRKLGQAMCVPFGNVLNRAIVPNTVTKSLHTEKMFYPDMKSFTIGAFPYYLNLENQIKMIRSFNRPVILVDDLLNKGYRLKVVDPLIQKEKIQVRKIIVGLLSGRGKELLEVQDREVDCAYFIPKLRHWFNESWLYPFMGGDTLWRGIYPQKNLIPSINLILPYTSPHFIKGVSNESIYSLSQVSIENAIQILKALEVEYQHLNERSLTLSHLSEVFIYPRYPDHGKSMIYDLNVNPSSHLENDLELLHRLEFTAVQSHRGGK